ncbi:PBSX family phage terminase large subunit [Bacteroides ovatus]|nr:PBSX family phage terminase large subunit [Bacteroides ovatus]MCE8977197.1 PBSX family phage terminase large subunit [Bacteroides ovatus]DAS63641.1 MAG TPA: terminase large subunit [Caudoviricetes sp.]
MVALNSNKFNVYVFEGGSRSSKTYSLIQFFIVYAISNWQRPNRIVIARKKSTWLSSTVWTDFKNILLEIGLYNVCRINNTLKTIQMYSTSFEFVGLDDVQRLHGLTTDIFWINEAMEASKDDFDQLEQRCARFSVLDYNPSAEEHWIYENVCPREDCFFDHSTMLDNPFIPANMRRKIESYEPTEYNYSQGTADKRKWLIYGLGKRAKIEGLIFENYTVIKEIPIWVKRRWYGLDFGYTNDPTACSENGFLDNAIYIDEKFYRTNMLSSDIIKEFKRMPKLNIWSESADPRLIAEIYNAGFNIRPVNKYHGSVEAGIDFMKSKKIYITEGSINAKKELDNYTYQQDKNGKWLNIPVDDFNHIIDEVRYCCMMELMGRKSISKGLEAFNH